MMVQLQNASLSYGSFEAVRDVSFELKPGELTGFLGPNGAGKTTTMRMITGFLKPTRGRVLINGADLSHAPASVRTGLGYLPEHNPLYSDMTVLEFLNMAAALHKLKGPAARRAVAEVVARCRLQDRLRTPIAALSKGYKQRVGLAQAILHDPEILILDEPTTGLDPNQIREIRSMIADLGARRTVLLSTHLLEQVPDLCSRVLVMRRGRLIFDGSPRELAGPPTSCYVTSDLPAWDTIRPKAPFIRRLQQLPDAPSGFYRFRLSGDFKPDHCAALTHLIREAGGRLIELEPRSRPLDQAFAQLTETQEETPSAGSTQGGD